MKTTGDALREVVEAIDALKDAVIVAARNDLVRIMRNLTFMALDEDTRERGTNLVEPKSQPPGWYRDRRCDTCGSKFTYQAGDPAVWACPIGCEDD